MSEHTPGPWLIEGSTVYALEHYGWRKGVEQFLNRFYVSVQRGPDTSDSEIEANVRLIAAAPDLLEALQTICDSTVVLNHLDSEAQQMICDAIKKATEPK